MANYVETVLINEGLSAFNTHTFLRNDGVTGELVNQPLIYASELTPPLGAGQYMSIWEVWYSVTNFTIQFSWATLTNSDPFMVLAPGVDSRMKFHRFGGLVDSSGLYAQGGLLMSTTGFNSTASYGHIILRCRKHENTAPAYKIVGQPRGLQPGVTYSNTNSGTQQ